MFKFLMNYYAENRDDVNMALKVSGAITVATLLMPQMVAKATSLIFAGGMLSLGFWCGRRITNNMDAWLASHNKDLLNEIANELGAKE